MGNTYGVIFSHSGIFLKEKKTVIILHKSIAGRYRSVRVADGPITARYRFIKNASWEFALSFKIGPHFLKGFLY